jgi:ribose transport system ATP-binding protein
VALLEANKITKRFGGVVALDNATFSCDSGTITALVGENGAGKSTMVKVVCGVHRPDGGEVLFKGQAIHPHNPADAGRLGIVSVFQELSLMPHLTVAQNIWISDPPRNSLGLIDFREQSRRTEALLSGLGFPGIDPDVNVADLPLADRQLVEIAHAVQRNPDLLILDEGTSALAAKEVTLVFDLIRRLRDQGKAIVFISHRMSEVGELCDVTAVFRNGKDVKSFRTGSVPSDEIVQLMIGHKLEKVFPPKPVRSAPPPTVLELKHINWENALHDVSLTVGKGEIVGLAGLEGQGQGDLLFALFGVYASVQGEVMLENRQVHISHPAQAIKPNIGLAMIPADRKTEGLVLPMTVGQNMTLSILGRIRRGLAISNSLENAAIDKMMKRLAVRAPSSDVPVSSLSGGNQQKVSLAKWLLTEAKVYLLHDPTRGIDVGTKQELYHLMRQLAEEGSAILFFSTDLTEIVGMCDRALVMYEGRIVRELVGGEITETNLVTAALNLGATTAEIDPAAVKADRKGAQA